MERLHWRRLRQDLQIRSWVKAGLKTHGTTSSSRLIKRRSRNNQLSIMVSCPMCTRCRQRLQHVAAFIGAASEALLLSAMYATAACALESPPSEPPAATTQAPDDDGEGETPVSV